MGIWRRGASVIVTIMALASGAFGAAGDLDLSFDGDGIALTEVAGQDDANAIVATPDGGLVAAGEANFSAALVRYRPDGSLDPDFGDAGHVTTAVGTRARAFAIARQPDGKLVIAGETTNSTTRDFLVARYQADGALDASFGSGGIVTTTVGPLSSTAYAVVLQPDGKLVAAGSGRIGASDQIAIVRYLGDGSLDPTFGGGTGVVTTDVASGSDVAFALALQPDGKLVAAGWAVTGGNYDVAVVRYLADGTLDTTFDGDGRALLDYGSTLDTATSVAVQPDGRVVVAGRSEIGGVQRITLARLDASGALDPSFAGDGIAVTEASPDGSNAIGLTLAADATLLVGGWARVGSRRDFALLRYLPDGSLDPSFGGGTGIVTTAMGFDALARDVAVDANGRIALTGSASTGINNDFAVVRYLGDALCGNGVLEDGETCDDGNQADGDCCSASCQADASDTDCADDALPCTADVCDGAGSCIHPPDHAGAVCRAAAASCDVAETCDGASPDCPADALAPDGTGCSDGTFCNGQETCAGGVCHPGVTPCELACDEATGACTPDCPPTPRLDCRQSTVALLQLKPDRERLRWSWAKGAATAVAELGAPDTGTDFALCVYGADGTPLLRAAIPAGPRWRPLGTRGWRYADSAASAAGIYKGRLLAGAAGRAKLLFKGRGPALPVLALPLPPAAFPVRVQLRGDDLSACWESRFASSDVLRNDARSATLRTP